jgi:site-specific DNA recombinase
MMGVLSTHLPRTRNSGQSRSGWIALPTLYDDGGLSGGTLERPALQRLLADIAAGRVDTVVVYKVDRLTRSLADFAKIVDAFDARGVAFVSVTQQFNTTTSMGRLTLNMLLSFAQFEREVTGERIRDKIAASKQRGMWMGGLPPLGYDVADRKLVINQEEAETVRHIFQRYAALGSVRQLKEELDAASIVSKARVARHGRHSGGLPIARGALYHMLQNRLYRGEIVHKSVAHPGQHEAIVDEVLWNKVQHALVTNRLDRDSGAGVTGPSLLTGLVHDGSGGRMSPTHANKRGTRYRYYVSQSLIKGTRSKAAGGACRVPAADLERIVEERLRTLLRDKQAIDDAVGSILPSITKRKALLDAAGQRAATWPTMSGAERRAILQALVARVTIGAEAVEIEVRLAALPSILGQGPGTALLPPYTPDTPVITDVPGTLLSVPAQLKRTGMETPLLVQGAADVTQREPDRSLLRLLAQAHRYGAMVLAGQGKTMLDLAAEAGVDPSYFTRTFRLFFLPPDITQTILQGRQPPGLTANKLKLAGKLAPTWADQRRAFDLG